MKDFNAFKKELKEDERLDTHFRTEARRIFALIKNFLDKNINNEDDLKKYFQKFSDVAIVATGKDLQLPENYNNLVIVFGSTKISPFPSIKSHINAFFSFIADSTGKEYPMIFIPVFSDTIINVNELKNINSDIETIFTHEFIHYLDYLRFKKPDTTFKKKVAEPNISGVDINSLKSLSAYVNSPAEFNAYYQEIMHKFEYAIQKSSTMQIAQDSTFAEFMEVMRNFIPVFMKEYLNQSYKRKLIRRLYSFWTEKIQNIKHK